MKNFELKHCKFVNIAIVCLLIALSATLLCACDFGDGGGSKNDLEVTISHNMYEYDRGSHSTGALKTDNNIKVGERYKLVFSFDFTNTEILGNSSVRITVTFTLGDFDTDENIAHIESESKEDGGGLTISAAGNGRYTAAFDLRKGSKIDYEMSYFIVGMDVYVENYQPVGVFFSADDTSFVINGGITSYGISLAPVKGIIDFSENNIVDLGGKNDIHSKEITIPQVCGQIKISIFKTDGKLRYGEVQYTESDFHGGKMIVNLRELMIDFIGEERYEDWDIAGDFEVLVKITVVGGKNYEDAVVSFTYKFS